MIKTKHSSVNLLITPNHKLYGAKRNTFKFYKAEEAVKFSNLSIPNCVGWEQGLEKKWFIYQKYYTLNLHLLKMIKKKS